MNGKDMIGAYLDGIDEENMAEAMLLEDLELTIFISSDDTFAYVDMFEHKELKEAVLLLWSDGYMDFGDKRGLYRVTLEVETGFEEGGFALYFDKFTRLDDDN